MPSANEITARAPGGADARRSTAAPAMCALRENKRDQSSGTRAGAGGTGAGPPSGASATNVPCPTCARARPPATSSS